MPSLSVDLRKRIVVTLVVLVVYRLGRVVAIPGLAPDVVGQSLRTVPGVVGWLVGSGGAMERLSVFALGFLPYLSAFVAVQIVAALLPRRRDEGADLGARLAGYTRWVTLALALFQSLGLANAFQAQDSLVPEPGPAFLVTATLSLTAGTLVLTWLAERISVRGLGNGVIILLAADLAAHLPANLVGMISLVRMGAAEPVFLLTGLGMTAVQIVIVVVMERARRRILVTGAAGKTVFLALPLNRTGVLAPIFAHALLPYALAVLSTAGLVAPSAIRFGAPLHLALFVLAIGLAVAFCTARAFDARAAADDLGSAGAMIPGVPLGEPTAAHLTAIVSRLTLIAAIYVTAICLMPELIFALSGALPILKDYAALSFLSGYGLLIVTWTALDSLERIGAVGDRR